MKGGEEYRGGRRRGIRSIGD
uniref:Uncharacterized protein n=1 Tax=Nelumbo nucifera TaxID=4432 RepID=A0A822YBU9_NELNU|nr:TPA_asm: hypothetical protein HUJ06_031071 [Nelumbo nucifera]